MGAYLIDRDGGGEGKALKGGFLVVDFGEFFVDEVVGEDAEVNDFGSDGDFFDEFREDVWVNGGNYRWRFWQRPDTFR